MKRKLLAMSLSLALLAGPVSALAEVVVVVSKSNPVETMSQSTLEEIFLGRRNEFPDGSPAVPIDQHEGSSAYPEFYSKYLDRTTAQIRSHWSRLIFTGRGQPPRSVRDGEAMAGAIAQDPDAIGYIDAELVDERLRVIQIE